MKATTKLFYIEQDVRKQKRLMQKAKRESIGNEIGEAAQTGIEFCDWMLQTIKKYNEK